MTQETNMKLAAARFAAAKSFPYLRVALFSMRPVESEGLDTCGVDKHWRLYYNPRRIEEWSLNETAGVLLHEALHLVRDHASRAARGNRDKILWNIAADLEINDDLVDQNCILPEGVVLPGMFNLPNGCLAEEYYDRLTEILDSPLDKVMRNLLNDLLKRFACDGSGATNVREPWEMEGNEGGVSERVANRIRKEIAERLQGIGYLPEDWRVWKNSLVKESRTPWQTVLAAHVSASTGRGLGASDWTYSKPSRRQTCVDTDVILPALYQPQPLVAIVMDTSGSMYDRRTGNRVLSEIEAICKACDTSVRVLSCDADVHRIEDVMSAHELHPTGGGGTDMGTGIAIACKLVPRPDLIIVITDGDTPWPDARPPVPVIVAVTRHRNVPSWATAIYVDD